MIPNLATIQAESLERPERLVGIEDRYGSKITRITGNTGDPMPVVGGEWFLDSRQKYSKRQPWNDDQTLLLLDQRGGDPRKLVVDAKTFEPLWSDREDTPQGRMLRASYEVQWLPGYPDQAVSTQWTGLKGFRVIRWNTTTGEILWDKIIDTMDQNFGWAGEAQISDDGRWTVFSTRLPAPQTNAGTGLNDYLVIVDLLKGKVGPFVPIDYATRAFPTSAYGEIGNVGISPKGNFVEVKLSGNEQYGFILDVDKDSLTATPHQMAVDALRMGPPEARGGTGAALGATAWLSHPDFNIDPMGFEVVVGGVRGMDQSNSDPQGSKKYGNVVSVDLLTGRHRHCSPGETQLGGMRAANLQHGSGRAHRRRGWHLISTEMTGGWGAGEIQWVLLDGTRTIERLCLHRSDDSKAGGGYRAEAHPVASPNGDQVMFASNWQVQGSGGPGMTDIKGYVVTAADGAPPQPGFKDRYYLEEGWVYSPAAGIIDRTTNRLVPLPEALRMANEYDRLSKEA